MHKILFYLIELWLHTIFELINQYSAYLGNKKQITFVNDQF